MTRVRLGGRTRLDDVRRVLTQPSSALGSLPDDARAVWADPEVRVDLDLVLPGGAVLRARHRMRAGRVVALAGLGGSTPVEASWFAVTRWAGELARAVTVNPPPAAGRRPLTAASDRLPECRARLLTLVVGPRVAGIAGWVLLGDGWRTVEPAGDRVRLAPVAPAGIAAAVLTGVAGVRP